MAPYWAPSAHSVRVYNTFLQGIGNIISVVRVIKKKKKRCSTQPNTAHETKLQTLKTKQKLT